MDIREVSLGEIDVPKLKVNGHIFELNMSDYEVMNMSNALQKKYKDLGSATDRDVILGAVKEVVDGIDKILGEGAVAKISNGKPVSIATAMRWLRVITQEAMEVYADELARSYE